MYKLLTAFLILSGGAIWSGALHRSTQQARARVSSHAAELQETTNLLADLESTFASLRQEVAGKKAQLRTVALANDNAGLLTLLEGNASEDRGAWGELRRQLGIGWTNSEEYVLVSKRVIKRFEFSRLSDSGNRAADIASAVLALSREEQAGIKAAIKEVHDAPFLHMQRMEPSGDIVAQYSIVPDASVEQSASNNFSASINSILGPERSELFLPQAWRALRSGMTPDKLQPATVTIRRSLRDGEPDLLWELQQGPSRSTGPMRFAHTPATWFSRMFPGGWEAIAQSEGFELPKKFRD